MIDTPLQRLARIRDSPDLAWNDWKECARSLNLKIPTATFAVHDEMERTATDEERATGADMGDRWIRERNEKKQITKRVSW